METEVLTLKILEYPVESSEAGAGKNELTVETIHPYRHATAPIIVLVIAYLAVLIVGVTGNFLVIITVAKTPRMRTVTNYFITNLALADLLVLVFCLPPTLISNIYVPSFRNDTMIWRKWKVWFYGTKVKDVCRVGFICFITWGLFWILYWSLLRLFGCHSLSPFWNWDETGYDYDRSPENPDDFIFYDEKMEASSSVEFQAVKNYLDKYYEASESKDAMNQSSLSCRLPRLSSGGKIARRLDREQFLGLYGGKSPNCVDNSNSQKLIIDFDSNLIRLEPTQKFWQDALCEYRVISRAEDEPDFIIGLSERAYRIDKVRTKLRPGDEFIDVRCTSVSKSGSQKIELIYEDELAQVPLKPSVESLLKHLPLNQQPFESHKHFSVLIVGLKSVSHQSFIRHMPRSYNYLTKKMGAIAFHGYHSIGPDMRENMFSLLTGLRFSQLKNSCLADADYLDDCPFIWKDYARLGYRTSYAEDAIPWSLFNGYPLKGFSKQPFDYDLRTLTGSIKEGLKAGHDIRNNVTLECHSSRLMFETLLDNMLKTAYTLKKKPYWHMTWSNLLTANANGYAKFGDRPLVAALKKLNREKLLEQTILFILSDHGISFGKLRTTTEQGAFEHRLPLLYIVLPKYFNVLFPKAVKNLQANSHKLITASDLHSTMKHLISIGIPQPPQHAHTSLSPVDEALEELHTSSVPIMQIRYDRRLEIEFNSVPGRNSAGASLLMPIPLHRSCEDVGIDKRFCACLSPDPVNPEDVQVKHAVAFVVSSINDRLKAHKQCANLSAGPVKAAWTFAAFQEPAGGKSVRMVPTETAASRIDERSFRTPASPLRHLPIKVLELHFITLPGRAEWHAVVRIHRLTTSMTLARIKRVNSLALSRKCTQDRNIHDFCYCLPKSLG